MHSVIDLPEEERVRSPRKASCDDLRWELDLVRPWSRPFWRGFGIWDPAPLPG